MADDETIYSTSTLEAKQKLSTALVTMFDSERNEQWRRRYHTNGGYHRQGEVISHRSFGRYQRFTQEC